LKPKIKQISEAFSGGQFKTVYEYLSENIEWKIFGEKVLQGKESVIEHCEQVAGYFQSVTVNVNQG
jgi:hypothetical protein